MGLKSLVLRLVRRGGAVMKRSPRLSRVVFAVLARSPWLNVRFRRLYLRSQLSDSLPVHEQAAWLAGPRAEGVHAQQRTPLEAHFHHYVERE